MEMYNRDELYCRKIQPFLLLFFLLVSNRNAMQIQALLVQYVFFQLFVQFM